MPTIEESVVKFKSVRWTLSGKPKDGTCIYLCWNTTKPVYQFCKFAGIGGVKKWYIQSVYKNKQYIDTVKACAMLSMEAAVEEVKKLSSYAQNGEWVITDARHDSTANTYHTTVPCLSGSTHRVLGISTVSRKEHQTAQTRELVCTKHVLPQVKDRGLKIVEVAHDFQLQVRGYITKDLKLENSFDTWHGTKNVAKEMKKIAQGALKREGVTWFTELSDKRKSTKVHLYWAMKNCTGTKEDLQKRVLNISKHYQDTLWLTHQQQASYQSVHTTLDAVL